MLSVSASCHQSHPKFFGHGRQCVANSYAAMIHHSTVKKASKWRQEDLDKILMEGDNIYFNVKMGGQKEEYLFVSDLPSPWNDCQLKILPSDLGLISNHTASKPYVTLTEAIKKIENFLFLTIKCYTKAIIKENNMYYVFDPHSRDKNGMVEADGKAMLTAHENFEKLIVFLKKFAFNLNKNESECIPFESTPVVIAENTCISDSEDCDGFSEISDGEYACLLQIIEDNKQDKIKRIEEQLEVCSTPSDASSDISASNDCLSPILNNYCESNRTLKMPKGELSEDDIPLSKLSELLRFDQLNSDSEHLSSGSEYKFSDDEKKMLDENYSETDSSEADLVNQKKRKLNRKLRKRKRNKRDVSSTSSAIEHSYYAKKVAVQESADDEEIEPDVVEKEQNNFDFECEGQEGTKEINFEKSYQEIASKNTTMGFFSEKVVDNEFHCDRFDSAYVVEIGQDLDIAAEIIIGQVSEENIATESEIQQPKNLESEFHAELDQDLDTARQGTIDEKPSEGSALECEPDVFEEGVFDLEASNDSNIAKDSAENLADTSIDNHSADVSFDDCISENFTRGRKRTRNPDNWKRNKNKRCCNTGERYINRNGKLQHAKKIKSGCGQNCRYKCQSKFTDKDREEIFHSYWRLGDVTRQRQFLLKYSSPQKKKSKIQSSHRKRETSFLWTLPLKGGNEIVRVCKTFFLHTLNISPQRVQTAMKKSKNIIGALELEKRGSHSNRPNKTSQCNTDFVVSHIKSFPAVESHYCRKNSRKMYLSPDLSVAKMYDLYLKECAKSIDVSPVSLNQYRHIFNSQFNIAFQKPVKDQCDICNTFKNVSNDDKIKMKDKFNNHIKNKELSRENKSQDKKKAQENNDETFLAACFDLEQVLMTPKAFDSSLYYKRRLNTFNFSIYDLGSSDGYCYLWNESVSGRGACEISSGVFDFLVEKSKQGKKNFVFYSDNCSAQNKNKYYVSMLWYTIQKYNLESVEQKYLEKGHTQNENDSVHACIERASRHVCVYTTAQWAAIIRTARRKQQYHVKEMDLPNFFDFKSVSKMLKNFDLDFERNKVRWTDVRSFKIESSNPNIVAFKYDYDGPVHHLDLVQRLRRSGAVDVKDITLHRLNQEYPKITFEKYKDLISLCKSGIIPYSHHMFYTYLSYEFPK